ncbi:hypothetical protein H257_10294 [Aphanomyces astaci]|uniref:Uncharacterized protein n=1 Tax=Aphanomyces astaci TaxID=112090 RepID=W4G921_APHAT|nr:hypothetical protein H257_10294 [Aphanomyces astaci]ETV75453.1 hypothetical protein H257_10294 [Aphanomyces astaci]|eukprot:XP_009835087.1 hypothetical protein H257_10294 [Aphanomyces astaci]
MKLNADELPHVLPLVQGALNQQPTDRLGRLAHVTALTSLPAKTPLEVYVADWLGDTGQKHVTDFMRRLKKCTATLRWEAAPSDRKSQVKFAGFSVSYFVLLGTVVDRPTKLALH